MKHKISDQVIEGLVRRSLQSSSDQLDQAISYRLQADRRSALQASSPGVNPMLAGAALASFCVIGLLVWFGPINSNEVEDELYIVEEVFQLDENPELVEDIEFYQWLAETYAEPEKV